MGRWRSTAAQNWMQYMCNLFAPFRASAMSVTLASGAVQQSCPELSSLCTMMLGAAGCACGLETACTCASGSCRHTTYLCLATGTCLACVAFHYVLQSGMEE
jgi:hypothetical protein